MVTKKRNKSAKWVEGMLTSYVMLTPIQFIERWVIFELYNEFLLEMFLSRVAPLSGLLVNAM
jgi:hypothetical protein